MKDKILDLAASASVVIAQMVGSLGVASSRLYAVLVRQMLVEGVVGLLYDILFIALGVAGLRWLWSVVVKQKYDPDDVPGWHILAGIVSVVVGLILLFPLFSLQKETQQILNPEYYAIERIVDKITK